VCKYFKFPVGHPTIHLDCGDVQVMLAKKRTSAMHSATTQRFVSPGVAIFVQRPPNILFIYDVRRVGISRAMLSRDGLGEGSDCHLGCGRSEGRCPTWLHSTQNTRILRVRGNSMRPKTGEGGHFVQYIDTFLKLKAEASGYPGGCRGLRKKTGTSGTLERAKASSSIRI